MGKIHRHVDRVTWIGMGDRVVAAGNFQERLVGIGPALTAIPDCDSRPVAQDGVGGFVLAIGLGHITEVANDSDVNRSADQRKFSRAGQATDATNATAHHGQLHEVAHHFPRTTCFFERRWPQVAVVAIKSTGVILGRFDPGRASNPQPATGGQCPHP